MVLGNNWQAKTFTKEEIELIDDLIFLSIKKKAIISEEELNRALLNF